MTRGVVVGKFYPPHAGHRHLIDTAAAQVDRLDVFVCDRRDQTIPAAIRASWLRETHAHQPNVHVREIHDFEDDDNSEAWAHCIVEALGYVPDVAFTSEDYGERFARCMGARHVSVDRDRRVMPVSGTLVRADPLKQWAYLAPPVRAWYAVRVAVVGAESTGTTTLARALAGHYGTDWVPEYGREYCEQLVASGEPLEAHRWKTEEFLEIARTQLAREDEAARRCNRLLFCDTDILATSVWHERYVGTASAELRAIAASRHYALHVLTDCDIGFVQDGLRDGEHVREWMTARFREELAATGRRWLPVSGTHENRMSAVTRVLDEMLARPGSRGAPCQEST
jgi:NadR type nicotinamide-nucleotide adenylyltransferase